MVWRSIFLYFRTRNPFFDVKSSVRYSKWEKFKDFVSEIHHLKLPLFVWALNPSDAFSENPTDTLLYLFFPVDSDYRY
jgi:hypothetical protein